MHVYPAPGLKVRDPVKKDLLPDDGREVSDTDPFWARRVFQGDVVTEKPAGLPAKKSDVVEDPDAIAHSSDNDVDQSTHAAEDDAENRSDV